VQSCSDATIPAMTNASITRLYPLENGLLAESRQRDVRGNETVQTVTRNPATLVTTTTLTSPASTLPTTSLSLAGLTTSSTDQHGCTTTYTYDALGRQKVAQTFLSAAGSPSGERRVATYTHYNVLGQVDYTEDALGTRTIYTYDSIGRKVAQTFLSAIGSLSNSTYTAYDAANRPLAIWGATYPVAYEYDTAGRMIAMYTYRGTNETEFINSIRQSGIQAIRQSADCTRWLYDEATGLLTNKLYADNRGPSYTYTALGQLSTRKWARLDGTSLQLQTLYSYDSFGALTNTAYSDSTPSISFTFDAMGRTKVAQTFLSASGAIISSTTNIYSGLDLVAEIQNGVRIDRQVDTIGRPKGLAIGQDYSVEYGFNEYGQFSSVKSATSADTNLFTYSYLPNSHLVSGYTATQPVSSFEFQVSKSYEPNRDLITTVSNTFGIATISAFNYENDAFGHRTARVDITPTLTVTNAFGYNLKSEVTSAMMGENEYGYDYDPIGNRIQSAVTVGGGQSETNIYTANALNQYSNLQPKDLQPINPSYDLDGNMVTNGVWSYTWDAENRLTAVYSNNTLLVCNVYDHQSRRIVKNLHHDGTKIRSNAFVWDGWSMVQELITDHGSLTTNLYTWGLDLSGSLQGAGGVGGLLAVSTGGTVASPSVYFPCFDANGNVNEYIDSVGTICAHYAFDAFGNTISQSGDKADSFTYRFSTKYTNIETGLYYYGYRYYEPELGRWLNPDPIEEEGGMNVYGFVGNEPLGHLDILGNISVPTRGNSDLIWDLDLQYRPIGHPDLKGAYGRTNISPIDEIDPPQKIVKVNKCCAKIERACASKMVIRMIVPTRAAIGKHVTNSGYNEIRVHERKRGSAYLDGFEAIYGPVSGTGSAVLKCGVLCRAAGWEEAKSLLSEYVFSQRLEAYSQFQRYALRAQAEIGRENRYWGTISQGGRELFDRFTQHFTYTPPPAFDDSKVACPVSN
jgi:RHS repeat-associated protein